MTRSEPMTEGPILSPLTEVAGHDVAYEPMVGDGTAAARCGSATPTERSGFFVNMCDYPLLPGNDVPNGQMTCGTAPWCGSARWPPTAPWSQSDTCP